MGMYVCIPHQQECKLSKGTGATNHAACEICGYLNDDWSTKFPVAFTHDVDRPFGEKDLKQCVIDQLARRSKDTA